MERNPSGEQWRIGHGGLEVVVVEVGGGLRTFTQDGRDLLAGYGVDEQASAGRGQVLIPWPNRIGDGQYSFEGQELQLALTEPDRRNAIHGLVRWALWSLDEQQDGALTVTYRLHPQQGWSWHLDLGIRYGLDDDGLTVTTTATNAGSSPAPFGHGVHPYLALGSTPLDQVRLRVPADTCLTADDRMLPTGRAEVADAGVDYRQPRVVGDAKLDTTFTDLHRDASGRWEVLLSGLQDRPGLGVWGDTAYPWAQVFTGNAGPDAHGERGIAVEPMSCPPNAFRSGESLVVLQAGESWSGSWGIRVHG